MEWSGNIITESSSGSDSACTNHSLSCPLGLFQVTCKDKFHCAKQPLSFAVVVAGWQGVTKGLGAEGKSPSELGQ